MEVEVNTRIKVVLSRVAPACNTFTWETEAVWKFEASLARVRSCPQKQKE